MDANNLIAVVKEYEIFYKERPSVSREDTASPTELTRRECDDLVHVLQEVLKFLKSNNKIDG